MGLQGVTESFVVKDESGSVMFELKYKMHAGWQEWHVLDASGAEVANMQRHMHIHPTFTIDRPGHQQVTVAKADFMPVNQTWSVTGLESGDVTVSGSVTNHEFVLADASGKTVAEASRRWATLHEGYAMQLQGLDPVIAVCTAVGMDVIENEQRH
jgi:uncharacterized protein YxjI